ncbi:MAG: metallophosphoesterase [Kiritimatiellae bacterium]|nr:metallophosphoesterase [Kiritimatiellia bacterium]
MNASHRNAEKIVVIGDLHYTERADSERAALWHPNGIPRLLAASGRVARDSGATLALQIGDLVGGEEADGVAAHEALIAGAMDRLESALPGVSLAVVPGNHDTRGEGGPEAWAHNVPPANRSIPLGDDALILLDSNAPDETFAALPRLLLETADCRRLFIAVHHPVIPCYYGLSYRSIFLGEPERDSERLEALRLLAERHAIVLCGHVHTNGFIDWHGVGGRIVQVHVSSLWDGLEPALRETISTSDGYGRFYEREGRADAAAFFASFRNGLAAYRHFEGAGFALVKLCPDALSVDFFGGADSSRPLLTLPIDGNEDWRIVD